MKISHKSMLLALFVLGLAQPQVFAKHSETADPNQNGALILGLSGEAYPIYGTGGIRVTGGHHGIFSSNMKSSQIEVDGSGITAQKISPAFELADFTAAPHFAYFVYHSAVCTLPTAQNLAGEEIIVSNGGKDVTVTYQTVNGETLFGAQPGAPLVNSTPGKVDKFLSDGKVWYRE